MYNPKDIYETYASEGSEFCTVRYPDFSDYPYRTLPLLHTLMPSIESKATHRQE